MTKISLCALLLLIPILSAWWPTVGRLSRNALLRSALLLGAGVVLIEILARRGRLSVWAAPWLPCTLSRFGKFNVEDVDQLVASSVTYPMWLRVGLTLVTMTAAWVVIEQVWQTYKATRLGSLDSGQKSFLWILGPASLCYMLLLVPRASSVGLLDRYVMFMLPFAIGFLLLLYQRSVGPAVPLISFIVLLIFAIDAVGDSHDYYADQRAGDAAIRELMAAGISRTAISQSMNSDAWTQVLMKGYMRQPDGSDDVDPNSHVVRKRRTVPCATYMEHRAPIVKPEYYMVFSPSSCLQPSAYPPVSYRAWLPPFHRQQYIERPK